MVPINKTGMQLYKLHTGFIYTFKILWFFRSALIRLYQAEF